MENQVLQHKMDDFENCVHRVNLRITGTPESAEQGRPEFMSSFHHSVWRGDIISCFPVIKRSLNPQPGPKQPAWAMMVHFHHH